MMRSSSSISMPGILTSLGIRPAHYVKPYMPDYQGEQVYPAYWDWEDAGYTARDLEIGRATYMGEITMVDRWFGLLADRLKTLGFMTTPRSSSSPIMASISANSVFSASGVFAGPTTRFR